MVYFPTSIPTGLRLPVKADLRLVVRMAMESLGRRSAHRSDRLEAEVAADRIIEAIREANYVILQGPAPGATTSHHPRMDAATPIPVAADEPVTGN